MQKKDLKKFDLPDSPGVYFFIGKKKPSSKKEEILYIGKATSLKDRVASYFSSDLINSRGAHIVDMVFRASKIKYEKTDTVLEAILLEANLIKKYKPYYNTKEKDDKSWNSVVVTKEEFPRILLVREKDIDRVNMTVTSKKAGLSNAKISEVFGPYPKSSHIKEVLRIIRKIFPYDDNSSRSSYGAEFYKQIGLSPDKKSKEAKALYKHNIKHIEMFLDAKKKKIISELKKKMQDFSKQKKFEEAAKIRNKIFAIDHINDIALLKNDIYEEGNRPKFRIESYDISHHGGKSMVGVMVVLDNKILDKNEYRKFNIKSRDKSDDTGALKEVLERRFSHTEWSMPDLIVIDGGKPQYNAGENFLKKHKIYIPLVTVVKDEKHKPKGFLGDETMIKLHKEAILLSNSEAHRFAITFHKKKRSKDFIK